LAENVLGIDVSNNNGLFYWPAWAGRISFAMAKATEGPHNGLGTYYDTQFARNWQQMWDLNGAGKLVRFAYCFGHPSEDPLSQADALTTTVRQQGLKPGDHFVLDLEDTDGLPPEQVSAWATAFCHRINSANPEHRVLVYTYVSFAAAGNCAGLEPWHLWIANYGVETPSIPAPWSEWTLWQTTGTGIDRDEFNGDQGQLLEFARFPASRR
jgi:lysozyme